MSPVPSGFHARNSARGRRYRYLLLESPIRPAIEQGGVGPRPGRKGGRGGRDQVVGHLQSVEPEFAELRENAAFVGYSAGHDPVEGANAVRSDQQ